MSCDGPAVEQVKEKWGKLTDDDLTLVNVKRDQLVGKIQERYGIAKGCNRKAGERIYAVVHGCPLAAVKVGCDNRALIANSFRRPNLSPTMLRSIGFFPNTHNFRIFRMHDLKNWASPLETDNCGHFRTLCV
jgi:uncharacterized protein YjbJ (UPF0337 family)